MKTYIVLDLVSFLAGFIMLCCLLSNALVHAALFLWLSMVIGGISMHVEAKQIAANRVNPIKGLHDWNKSQTSD